MSDFSKFPEQRLRRLLDQEQSAALVGELLSANSCELLREPINDDRYSEVEDDPAHWPGPPPAFAAPRPLDLSGDSGATHQRIFRPQGALARVQDERLWLYPEAMLIGGLWIISVIVGVWRALA